jgi:hypothetical protein
MGPRKVLALAVFASTSLVAQEHPLLRDHAGGWIVQNQQLATDVASADKAAAAALVADVANILKQAPTLKTPRGYDVYQHSSFALDRPGNATARPAVLAGILTFNLAPYESGASGPVANERDTAVQIKVAVNDLSMVTGGTMTEGRLTFGDDQGDFWRDTPEPSATLNGAPVYEQNSDHWIVLRAHEVPIVTPVSRERYLAFRQRLAKDAADHAQQNLARLNTNDPALAGPLAIMREQIAALRAAEQTIQQQLAAMSPADRQAPALVTSESQTQPPQFGDGGTPVVYLNPALFDPTRPRGTPQVLAVSIVGDEDHWSGLASKIDREIDWEALRKLLR